MPDVFTVFLNKDDDDYLLVKNNLGWGGGRGAYKLSYPEKGGGLIKGREIVLEGGLKRRFRVYFTIVGVKKIVRRFFISRFHCIRAYPFIVF